jgi:uncharacterized protein YoaH (UPF0181 family)
MGLGWTRPKTNFEADVADDKAKDPTNGGSAFDGRTLTSLLSAPSTPSTPTPMPATVNTTNYDPNQQKIMDQISQRISGDMGAGEASRLAAGKIRESSVGANKEAAANRTMRGVSGTGADAFDQSKISAQTQRAIAGSTSDIASNAEQQKNSLLGTAGGLATSQAQTAQNAQQLALQQWQEQEASRRADQQAQIAQQQAQLQMLNSYLSMSAL